ncbi:PLP-dependent aminotransferase family protein [Massilia sp. BJB1822]|uniref:MocR-like pyridoxine biosynthesis transcription factor PdxR n=1 Tax=Massilia sp. BJB1822 TaxID=2744470 RepID=UPI001593AAD1|nr:PLP-dependent aminotransferase family protein [Massilia sp. BJB1822]NVD99818.1 PLP-dependent aminotransferase family protein [Massilia sp. BJB1822]
MPRTPQSVELPAIGTLDRSAGNLGRQLAQALREAVRCGGLKPGEPLPSTRLLATSLGLARGTVVETFEQLVAEGILESQPGAGTRVAQALAKPFKSDGAAPSPAAPAEPAALPPRAAAFAKLAQQLTPLPAQPFSVSVPVGRTAPLDDWRRIGNRIRATAAGAPAGYDHPQGVPALRQAIADYVRRSRSVRCHPDQIVITSGTQQGLHLCCQILLDTGDTAWVENPAYPGITSILENTGRQAAIARVPVDAEGIDVAAGIELAPHARAAFVTPSHQYPLGMPMSMARRKALLAWAGAHNGWIVEDDYDSEMRYAGHPFPSLQGLEPERVVYLGTFSKILFPSLRLGYAIVPEGMTAAFCGARALMDRHPPSADQHVLAAFMQEGHLDRHIRRIRSVYAERREQLVEMLERLLPSDLAWVQPCDQGLHLLVWLADSIDDRRLSGQALEAGVSVRPVSPMYAGKGRPGLILGLGDYSREQTEAAVKQLARTIQFAGTP